jgi:dsRNA-specific ribonuclease
MCDITDEEIIKTDEGYIYNPYNPVNIEITLNDVQSILRSYGLPTTVNNFEYYKLAFVHKSYTKKNIDNEKVKCISKPSNCIELKDKSNERLEFLGDGILEAITKFYLYKRFPNENEGFMTEKKIAIVKNESIGKFAYEMKINKWLLLSNCAEEKKNRSNYKKLGCIFEAFIGALFLDLNNINIKDENKWFELIFKTGPGFQLVQIFLENIFEEHINWNELLHNDDNYKNKLQIILQKEFKTTPHYIEIERDIDGYNMGVYLCLGYNIHNMNIKDAICIDEILKIESDISDNIIVEESNINYSEKLKKIRKYLNINNNMIFLYLGSSKHKIKRKAEKLGCEYAINILANK